jgi:hypothetical protein
MGCEALPIEYYESLDSEKRLFGTKPLHKKTPIGDFFNIAILCLRYYNPLNCKWLSRDPICELGSKTIRWKEIKQNGFETLYGFVKNSPITFIDHLGMAFKYYGNWGGPGWAGGNRVQDGWKQNPPTSLLPPLDAQDSCYQDHDYGYESCRSKYPNCPAKQKLCFSKCDLKLSACLLTKWDLKSAFSPRRYIAVPTFILQPTLRTINPLNWF